MSDGHEQPAACVFMWREAWDQTFAWTPEAVRPIRVAGDEIAARADRYRETLERIVRWDASEARDPAYLSDNIIPAIKAALS